MATAVPMGTAVPVATSVTVEAEDAAAKKYEKLKTQAKWLNVVASALLVLANVNAAFQGTSSGCNPLLIKVVMAWMGILGILLILAELDVSVIRTYVHVLAYRSGRAFIALMVSTICMSAAPSELPIGVGYGYGMGGYAGAGQGVYVVSMHWEFALAGALVFFGAVYNLRLTFRSKA